MAIESPPAVVGRAAWLAVLPIPLLMLAAKTGKVFYIAAEWTGFGPGRYDVVSLARWMLLHFAWPRFAIPLALGALVALFLHRHRWRWGTVVAIGVFGLEAALYVLRSGDIPQAIHGVAGWVPLALGELRIFVACVWREVVAGAVLGAGLAIGASLATPSWRSGILTAIRVLALLLAVGLGIDIAYLVSAGQDLSIATIVFVAMHPGDMAPLILAETRPARVALLLSGVVFTALYYLLLRQYAAPGSVSALPVRRVSPWLAAVGVGACALLLPLMSAGSAPYERFTESTVVGFGKELLFSPSRGIEAGIREEFKRNGQPTWSSDGMKIEGVAPRRRPNIVIVMMESMRADATTMHTPGLPTTPFLDSLARQSMQFMDMSVVATRTAGAWMAVLGGQYPLTNEVTALWSDWNRQHADTRGLPAALHEIGYATAFFTPTHMRLLNESEVLQAMGFDKVFAEPELRAPGVANVNYMGLPDEVMIDPIERWTAQQTRAGKPFMLAVMTNVGHHAYETPPGFQGPPLNDVADASKRAYLTCMNYIDSIVQKLMGKFEALGLYENTLFAFVGDHGTPFGEHGYRLYNSPFQESIHVPALLFAPSMLKPGKVAGVRQQVDFVPTIVELLGGKLVGATLPGMSLLHEVPPDRTIFFTAASERAFLGMRSGSRKYVYDFGRTPVSAYDLAADPDERRPLPLSSEERDRAAYRMLDWEARVRQSLFHAPKRAVGGEARP